MSEPTGTLYVISAPSGAGKTSLTRALAKAMPELKISISHTTRPQRPGEENGEHYWFVSPETFDQMLETQAFLEHAKVFGNQYGTSKSWVDAQLQAGIDVILEIDWQGAQQIRKLAPQAVGIFILPPSITLLRQRLESRKQDSPQVITQRLAQATEELSHYTEFDYLIINDIFETALEDLKAIILSKRLQYEKQSKKFANLLAELLQSE